MPSGLDKYSGCAGCCRLRPRDVALLFFGWCLLCEPLGDAGFQEPEHSLNVGEGGPCVVVVIHEAVTVLFPVRGDFFNHESRLLHRRAAMFEVAVHFVRGFLQSAIQTESPGFRRADPGIGAVPLRW
jgi:hypothetical protein